MTSPAAVLFDMDGTLVDTEVLWWEATEEVAASLGHRLTDADAPEVVGRAVEDTAAHLIRVSRRWPGPDGPECHAVAAALTAGLPRAGGGRAPRCGPAYGGCWPNWSSVGCRSLW